jgi:hypothetical protein
VSISQQMYNYYTTIIKTLEYLSSKSKRADRVKSHDPQRKKLPEKATGVPDVVFMHGPVDGKRKLSVAGKS